MTRSPRVSCSRCSERREGEPTLRPATALAGRDALEEVRERHAIGLDAARPEAVAQRRGRGHRTARENLAELLDDGSFVEYGPLMFAAQEQRRSRDELIARTPADGLVGGVGAIDGEPCVAMSYDYTVLAGTQGMRNHQKKDRLFELAERRRLPVVLFAEGGGGRPGDVDMPIVAGLDCRAFHLFARLSGLVPLIGIASGYCFAGNAALLGCCDVVIATEDSSIGMGGPAMIEGGGLGVFAPAEVGPIDVQYANGVVDLRVADDAEAVAAAKRYLSYFIGAAPAVDADHDPARLRDLIPANRKRAYEIRTVIDALCDETLELRRGFGPGIVTALARIDGKPLGIVANDPTHLGGAIDADGADKAARFMALCDAFGLPLLFLCDTPGFMVGPDAERTATVRHFARMFVTGANLGVPTGTIVLRKGYGLGAQAMAGGGFKAPLFTIGWPTSEFGAMGLEGAVKLGMRRELEAIEDQRERERRLRRDRRRRLRARPRRRDGGLLRDRRRDRSGRQPPLDQDAARRPRPALVRARRQAPSQRRRLVARPSAAIAPIRRSQRPAGAAGVASHSARRCRAASPRGSRPAPRGGPTGR